ncbi:MAG: hypothetical protein AAFN63_18480 [Pseudomonadota bacterium]
MEGATHWKRRAALAGGALAVVGWVKGVPYLASLGQPDFEFEEIPGLSPFRRLGGAGASTPGAAIFAGLEPGPAETEADIELKAFVRSNPCAAFFGADPSETVPVAMFSDFACPICRVMDDRLVDLEVNRPLFAGDPELRILGHGKDEEWNTLSRGTARQSGAYGFGSRERIREQIGSDFVDFAEGWMQQGQLAYLGQAA